MIFFSNNKMGQRYEQCQNDMFWVMVIQKKTIWQKILICVLLQFVISSQGNRMSKHLWYGVLYILFIALMISFYLFKHVILFPVDTASIENLKRMIQEIKAHHPEQILDEHPSPFSSYQYIQIITTQTSTFSQNISRLFQSLGFPTSSYHISHHHLLPCQIEQNYNIQPLSSLTQTLQKLSNIRYFYNCLYTSFPCSQTTFIVSPQAAGIQKTADDSIFLIPSTSDYQIQSLLLTKYGFHHDQTHWYKSQLLKIVSQKQQDIQHISTLTPYNILQYIFQEPQLSHLEEYISSTTSELNEISQILRYDNHTLIQLDFYKTRPVKENSLINRKNLFAKDYKLGIYLPLLILGGYPALMLVKEIVARKWRKNREKKEEIGKKQERKQNE